LRAHPGTLLAAATLIACGVLAPGVHAAPAKPSSAKAAPSKPAPAKPAAAPGAAVPRPAAKPVRAAGLTSSAPHRPLTLAAQTIEGRSEAPRVLFVHTGPKIALEDAPKHPSYLRDDFTAALSSPVTVRVREVEPLRASPTPGGSR
jgi:hypothetical protein